MAAPAAGNVRNVPTDMREPTRRKAPLPPRFYHRHLATLPWIPAADIDHHGGRFDQCRRTPANLNASRISISGTG